MQVVIAYSPAARQVCEHSLNLPAGATVLEALCAVNVWASDAFGHELVLHPATALLGVWGKSVLPEQVLVEGDRLEIYRPLLADPKTARRERFLKQGKRGAGLFAKRRPGGKAGY